MLHPPPAEGWHSRLGGTAGEPSSRFHPYLNCRPDPRTLPGVGTSVYRSSSCALMDSAASRVSQGEPSAGASQGKRERGQCQLRFGDCPTLAQALLRPGSCCLLSRRPECVLLLLPFLLGLRRGAPGSFKGQGDHCSVGTVPQEHPALAGDITQRDGTRGCGRSKLGLASPWGFCLWNYSLSYCSKGNSLGAFLLQPFIYDPYVTFLSHVL